jgi:hypothetical protein
MKLFADGERVPTDLFRDPKGFLRCHQPGKVYGTELD